MDLNIWPIDKWNYLFSESFLPAIKGLLFDHHFNEKSQKGETVSIKIKFKVVAKAL